jgi:8-oxo-dGTP pyrophosphatase MutT (NUDIX family)
MEDPGLTGVGAFRELALARLRGFPHTTVDPAPGIRRAAVAICVVADAGGRPAVIVIKRAYRGRNAGQWGLPGGREDEGETCAETALRELDEEVGLAAGAGDVVGRLDDFPAASGFVITPVVVVPENAPPLRPSPDEVHSVHLVGLSRLAAPGTPRWVEQGAGAGRLLQMRLGEGMVVHPPTGAMLWQFREVVLLGRPAAEARVAHFLQPDWTHR